MPQQPKLRRKKVGKQEYWVTATGGGSLTYFGNVKETSFEVARKKFREHLTSLSEGTRADNVLTCADLIEQFLAWVEEHRSDATFDQRRRDCNRFGNFKVRGRRVFDLPATAIRSDDLKAWLKGCEAKDEQRTLRHRDTSIRHCWNWGSKYPSPVSLLPPTFRPFAALEKPYVPPKCLSEVDLITDEEIATLFEAARHDLDSFHRFGPKTPREQNPYEDFADMLRCYYHTGARTGELAAATVNNFLPKSRQVILGKHKTVKSTHTLRHITLNDEAVAIFEKQCRGKSPSDHIFNTSDGKPWKPRSLPARFVRIKEIASVLKLGEIREQITIYDFRHLWISEALMAGNEVATVARMAGTSINMIEVVYGHFRNEHLHEAQAKLDHARSERKGRKR